MPDHPYLRHLAKRLFELLVILGGTIIHPALAQTTALRPSYAIDPRHLELAAHPNATNPENRALLRLEWQVARSRIDEAATLNEMLQRLAAMEVTTRQLLHLLSALPSPVGVSDSSPAKPAPPAPSTLIPSPPAPTNPVTATPELISVAPNAATTPVAGPGKPETLPVAARSTTVAPPALTLRETPPQSIPTADWFDIASSLPLSLKLIGAVTLLLALSLAGYRWLLTHTPQTDFPDENRRPRHPPYLRGTAGSKLHS
jgi:hypothetical protein